MKDIVLELNNVSKSFKNSMSLENISFKVFKGDIFGFLGPNGAGKTTTLRMILNLMRPKSGEIFICGYNANKEHTKAIKEIGAIIETPNFHDYLSGEENLLMMARLLGIPSSKVTETISTVGLSSKKDNKFSTYSLGMKQRLGIANALLGGPKLIILDEPTNGLDPNGMKDIRDLIINLSHEKQITFLISTHLLYEVEQICNRVAILHNGSIVKEGEVKNLLDSSSEEIILNVSEKNSTYEILSKETYIDSFEEIENGFRVILSKESTSILIKNLVKANITIKYVIPVKTSLEDIFIKLTKGDDVHA